jgi:hypothetical protein
MEHETMNVTLSAQGTELLRAVHNRHPQRSVTEILEEALAERFGREVAAPRRNLNPRKVMGGRKEKITSFDFKTRVITSVLRVSD